MLHKQSQARDISNHAYNFDFISPFAFVLNGSNLNYVYIL